MKKLERIRDLILGYQAKGFNVVNISAVQRIMGKRKLFAIVHDSTFDGDNPFYCPDDRVEFHAGQTIHDIRKAFYGALLAKDYTPEEAKETTSLIEGAWIVDEDGLKTIVKAIDMVGGIGNDTTCYVLNRAAKGMADALAIKFAGKKPWSIYAK